MKDFEPKLPLFKSDFEAGPNTSKFFNNFESLVDCYQRAYGSSPWFEKLSTDEVQRRLNEASNFPGFESFIVENSYDQVIAAEIYDMPSLTSLAERKKNHELVEFAKRVLGDNKLTNLVWENELFVHPDYQGNKISNKLRVVFINHLEEKFPDGALTLTRLRDDNLGTIKSAEKVGFQRTGVRKLASQQPAEWNGQLHHEFWFRVISSHNHE